VLDRFATPGETPKAGCIDREDRDVDKQQKLTFNEKNITEFRVSHGQIASFGDAPLLLLTTTGARSGQRRIGADVPAYAAPARATDLSDLPACYVEVGQLDIFRDEDLAYAERLSRAGVPVEFHLRPGVPHEFETYAHASDVARRSVADRLRALHGI
jgi:acetyl esterase/lipase